MMPRFDSVCPIRAVSFRMRMWHPMAISQPPPRAWPLMAATTGLGKRSMRRTTLLPNRMKDATSGPEKALPRSAPAQKILSPAPVMMTERTAGSASTSDSAAFSSFMRSTLIALAGGRLSVMTAKLSSRVRMSVSYGIGQSPLCVRGDALQEQIGHGAGGVYEAISPLAQHPRRRHLVHGAEEHLGRHLDRQVAPEMAGGDALLEHRGDQGEVGGDLLGRGAAEELLPLPELYLHHLGQLRVALQDVEVHVDQAPHLGDRVPLLRDRPPQGRHELRHLLAEERDEDVFLGLEVKIDGAGGDPGLARDVGDAGTEVSLPGEDPDGGVDDLLGLVGIEHDQGLNRRSFYERRRWVSNGRWAPLDVALPGGYDPGP